MMPLTRTTSCGMLWYARYLRHPTHRYDQVLRRLGVKGVEIKKPEQLETVASLIIPRGESTTMAKLAEYHKLSQFPALREFVKMGKPVWGTCAGLIFLANRATGQKIGGQELVGGLDCMVHRTFFGSQELVAKSLPLSSLRHISSNSIGGEIPYVLPPKATHMLARISLAILCSTFECI